jgi:hypothetical protein
MIARRRAGYITQCNMRQARIFASFRVFVTIQTTAAVRAASHPGEPTMPNSSRARRGLLAAALTLALPALALAASPDKGTAASSRSIR